jgi:hypothetical protein
MRPQLFKTRDVEEHLRPRKSQIEQRHEALTAGDNSSARTDLGEDGERLVEIVGSAIEKRGGFHAFFSPMAARVARPVLITP